MMGLIITLFIVIVCLVVGIYVMFKQVSARKDDVSNYQVLKGGDDELVEAPARVSITLSSCSAVTVRSNV